MRDKSYWNFRRGFIQCYTRSGSDCTIIGSNKVYVSIATVVDQFDEFVHACVFSVEVNWLTQQCDLFTFKMKTFELIQFVWNLVNLNTFFFTAMKQYQNIMSREFWNVFQFQYIKKDVIKLTKKRVSHLNFEKKNTISFTEKNQHKKINIVNISI